MTTHTITHMQSIRRSRYGDADVLTLAEVPVPTPAPDDVLVRVHAAGVDPGVWHLMTGEPYLMRLFTGLRKPRTTSTGSDVAGTVEAVGSDVTEFAVGDEVFGAATGSFAEFALAKPRHLVHKPQSVSFEHAAALTTSGVTALQAVRTVGRLQAGQHVVVIGASGGVGSYAVQIARAMGAQVTGVCSTRNVKRVRGLGATTVIDYTRDDLTAIRDADLVIDTAGNRPLRVVRSMLHSTGTLVSVGAEGGNRVIGALTRNLKSALMAPFTKQRLVGFLAMVNKADLETLRDMSANGEIATLIDRSYPLEEAPDAVRHVGGNHARGKIVLAVQPKSVR